MLAALGYPGFASLKRGVAELNPPEVLLRASSQDELETRLNRMLVWCTSIGNHPRVLATDSVSACNPLQVFAFRIELFLWTEAAQQGYESYAASKRPG